MQTVLRWILLVAMLAVMPVSLAGSSPEEDFELAMVRYEQGDYERAIPHLNEVIELDPLFADAHKYLGRSLLKLERWVEAVERLTRAYELMPEAKKRLFWMELWDSVVEAFMSLLDRGELERALSMLEKAWQLPGQTADDRQRLMGVLIVYAGKLANEGRLDEALSILADNAPESKELLAL